MIRATTKRSNSIYVSHAVVRLEAIGENGITLGWSSGFVVDEKDFPSLYTCWHTVTGADPQNLPTKPPLKRVKLRLHTLKMESETPEITRIGGLKTIEINLFDDEGRRNWLQGDPKEGISGDLPPPHFDCVRFNVSEFRNHFPGAFQPEDDILNYLDISEDAFIVGYPYGYSAFDDSPDPVFLRRTRACMWAPNATILLDGPGAKGMSGGPVVTRIDNEWRLAGIYTGVVFPESTHFQKELQDGGGVSRLPLGKYTMTVLARGATRVSAENMGMTSTTGK